MYKVKYSKLLELLRENNDINIGSDDIVHIYINLETIILKMCSVQINEEISVNKNAKFQFIANIINLAAHYRMFFTKHKIESKIFLYMPSLNTKKYKNSLYNKDYRMYSRFKFSESGGNIPLYKMIIDTIPFIQLIIEYIQGVYFIKSEEIENSLIPHIINEDSDNIKSFIVTADLYDVQYVNYDCNIIIPKGDNSFICTSNNTINYLKNLYNCKGSYKFSSGFIPFILAVIGSKYRNIYNIKGLGMKSIYKIIQKAIDEKLVSNNIDNIYLLLNILKRDMKTDVLNNYKCIDINFQYTQLNKKDIYDIMSQIKDKFDNVALRKINDKYFIEYPIMLQEITATVNKRKEIKF
jgi:hypothetical protein